MNVVVKFYPWKKFCFPVLLGMVINVVNVRRIGKKGTKFKPRIIEMDHNMYRQLYVINRYMFTVVIITITSSRLR